VGAAHGRGGEPLGPPRQLPAAHDELVGSLVLSHGGRVFEHTGDGLFS